MLLKSIRFGVLGFGCLISVKVAQAYSLAPENFNALYSLAASGNVSSINYAKARGLRIDSVNNNGDTGLCVAARRKDKTAFRSFLQAGANPSHPCTWSIAGYNEFVQETYKKPTKNNDTAKRSFYGIENAAATTAIGGMSLASKALIGTGIIAAGAGVGMAVGGGGGGGSDLDPNCKYGNWNNGVCVCHNGYAGEKCDECDVFGGYDHFGQEGCYKQLECGADGKQVGSTCVCNKGYAGPACGECAEGFGRSVEGICTRKEKEKVVGNYKINSNFNDYVVKNSSSPDIQEPSPNGYETYSYINVENTRYTDVYGMFYDSDKTPHDYILEQKYFANGFLQPGVVVESVEEADYVYNADGTIAWYHPANSENPDDATPPDSQDAKQAGYIRDGKAYIISGGEEKLAGTVVQEIARDNEGNIIGTTMTVKDSSGTIIGYAYKIGTSNVEHDYVKVNKDSVINVTNKSDSYTYGLYSNNADTIYNLYLKFTKDGKIMSKISDPNNPNEDNQGKNRAEVTINNTGDGEVYGMFGNKKLYSGDIEVSGSVEGKAHAISIINVINNGKGSAYGMYNNRKDGEIYNLTKREEAEKYTIDLTSTINVTNNGSGKAYGIYGLGKIENSGNINVLTNTGDAFGIYTKGGEITNVKDMNENVASSAIVATSNAGNAYGAYIEGGKIINGRIIEANALGETGNAYGIYATKTKDTDVTVENTSGVVATSKNGDAYGIYNYRGSVTNSTQRYEIIVTAENGTAYGIYSDGGSVTNSGKIIVYGKDSNDTETNNGEGGSSTFEEEAGTGDEPTEGDDVVEDDSQNHYSFGIYATNGTKVTNTGEFSFNISGSVLNNENKDEYCNKYGCKTPAGGYAIYLTNGAKFVNAGNVESDTNLDLGEGGTQLAENGSFSATSLSGNLEVASSVVSSGFDSSYIVSDAIKSDDTSKLNIISESALFDATLVGTDVVLNKKDFSEVINDSKIAKFLEDNYALSNNEKLFSELKSKASSKELNSAMNDFIGQDAISRFADEDLILQNELNFDLNENLYKLADDKFSFSSQVASGAFDKSVGKTQYAISGKKIGKTKVHVGLAISDVKTKNSYDSDVRKSSNYQFMTPMQWKSNGFNTIVTPKIAYSYGSYSRDGYQGEDYKGKIEKQMLGVSSQLKYPINIKGFNLIPTSEANVMAYRTKISEDDKQFSLSSVDENTYSASVGFGAYLSKDLNESDKNRFNFMAGAMLYHEFANPYDLKMKMNNMKGHFMLTDEKRKDNYMVLRSKFSYNMDKASIYGDVLSYIDSEYRTQANIGFKYNF